MDEVRLRTVENFNSDNSRELFRKRVQFWLLYASVGLASLIGLGVAKHYSGNQPIHPPAVEAGDH
jgi:hypothetical protein